MNRPEVRIIQNQTEETKPVEVSGSEADYLLSKYGYTSQPTQQPIQQTPSSTLTFEEMFQQQQREEEHRRRNKQLDDYNRRVNHVNPYTFDPNKVGYSETKWNTMDIDGNDSLNIKVQIVSDMPIPKY